MRKTPSAARVRHDSFIGIGRLGIMTAIRHFGARLSAAGKVLLAGLVIVGVSGVATAVASSPAFAAGAPTVGTGYGAFGNSPIVNLTGCTGTTSSETLTCTNNPITAGVTVGMGAYGVDLDSTTPNSVTSVTATTIVLGADPSAAVTAAATETFTGTQAIGNASDATLSTTVTDSGNFADYGAIAGLEVYGAGIPAQTTVVSVSTTSMVLSQAPTAALSGTTLFFNAPDVNNVLTQVSGGASNVNTSSLTVVTQPPTADGYITTSTTSTTGIVNMYQALNPRGQHLHRHPGLLRSRIHLPERGQLHDVHRDLRHNPESGDGRRDRRGHRDREHLRRRLAGAFRTDLGGPGVTVTLTEAPSGGAVPTTNSGATVNYIDGDTYIMPVPSGLTDVPGSVQLEGGDAPTSASGATTSTYCTAAGPGCTACNLAATSTCPTKDIQPTPTTTTTHTSKSSSVVRRRTRPRAGRCTPCQRSRPASSPAARRLGTEPN